MRGRDKPRYRSSIRGVVSDGVGLQDVSVSRLNPSGQVEVDQVTFPNGRATLGTPGAVTAWNYTLTPLEQGLYHLSVIASNLAGNAVQLGTYNVQVNEVVIIATPTYSLTIDTAGNGLGSVTPAIGMYPYPFGTVVTLTAAAALQSTFTGWNGEVVTTTNPLTLTIYGNTSVTAFFAAPLSTTTTLTSAPNPSEFGQSVAFTATVVMSGTPTGNVTFSEGASTLGTAPLLNGVATWSTGTLTPGAHSITATYAGDANFNSSSGNVSQTVGASGDRKVFLPLIRR
jgi:large repetitive protein